MDVSVNDYCLVSIFNMNIDVTKANHSIQKLTVGQNFIQPFVTLQVDTSIFDLLSINFT